VEFGYNQHDPARARLYRCANPDLGALDRYFADFVDHEQQYHVTFQMQVVKATTKVTGSTAAMQASLLTRQVTAGTTGQQVDPWEFTFRKEDGWRLCGARPLQK
jgi:hypothetical protein